MPIARYFIFIGGTLAALLFIPGWLLPKPPALFADQSVALDRAVIRIRSAHKWPEKVILDTGQLTITPPVAMDPPTIQRRFRYRLTKRRISRILKHGPVKARYTADRHQSFNPANQTRRGKDRSIEAPSQRSRYRPASRNGLGPLPVWVG